MLRMLCVFTIAVAFVQGGDADKAKTDLDLMQGAWVMHALEINGKVETRTKDASLTITKDEYKTTLKGKEQTPSYKLKLDASKNPKWVDMILTQADGTQKVIKGIYLFEKDTIKISRALTAEQERPTEFATWPGTNYFVVTWKKK